MVSLREMEWSDSGLPLRRLTAPPPFNAKSNPMCDKSGIVTEALIFVVSAPSVRAGRLSLVLNVFVDRTS